MVTNVAADRLAFQRNKIDTMGLTALFDVIVLSGEIGVHKPDRRVFDYATRQLGVANEDCVFVGDNPDGDITGAINAGMEAVWIDVWGDGDRFAGNPRVHRVKSVLEYFQF
jgi:putative hydrolase of the HAD superfamily